MNRMSCLTAPHGRDFEDFFAASAILAITEPVLAQAVKFRQIQSMTLGDALIAATAFVHGHTLVTHNTKDFAWIEGLSLFDPLQERSGPS